MSASSLYDDSVSDSEIFVPSVDVPLDDDEHVDMKDDLLLLVP